MVIEVNDSYRTSLSRMVEVFTSSWWFQYQNWLCFRRLLVPSLLNMFMSIIAWVPIQSLPIPKKIIRETCPCQQSARAIVTGHCTPLQHVCKRTFVAIRICLSKPRAIHSYKDDKVMSIVLIICWEHLYLIPLGYPWAITIIAIH